jgi:hypothetical protein
MFSTAGFNIPIVWDVRLRSPKSKHVSEEYFAFLFRVED